MTQRIDGITLDHLELALQAVAIELFVPPGFACPRLFEQMTGLVDLHGDGFRGNKRRRRQGNDMQAEHVRIETLGQRQAGFDGRACGFAVAQMYDDIELGHGRILGSGGWHQSTPSRRSAIMRQIVSFSRWRLCGSGKPRRMRPFVREQQPCVQSSSSPYRS